MFTCGWAHKCCALCFAFSLNPDADPGRMSPAHLSPEAPSERSRFQPVVLASCVPGLFYNFCPVFSRYECRRPCSCAHGDLRGGQGVLHLWGQCRAAVLHPLILRCPCLALVPSSHTCQVPALLRATQGQRWQRAQGARRGAQVPPELTWEDVLPVQMYLWDMC